MNHSNYCENCGYQLLSNWTYCAKCGKNRYNFGLKECNQCGRVINDPDPIYCPFCQKRLDIQVPVSPKSETIIHKKPEPVYILKPNGIETKTSIKQFFSNYMFDTRSTVGIMNNPRYTIVGLLIILISGVSSSILIYFSKNLLDNEKILPSDIRLFTNMISQIALLFAIVVSITIILSILQTNVTIHHFIRIMGTYAVLFVIKDCVLIILSLYMSFFNSGSFYMTSLLFSTPLLLVHIFVFIHLSVTTKAITHSGLTLSLLLVLLAYIMGLTFAGGYLGPFIELIFEFIL